MSTRLYEQLCAIEKKEGSVNVHFEIRRSRENMRRELIVLCLASAPALALNLGLAMKGVATTRAWNEFKRDTGLSPRRLGVDVSCTLPNTWLSHLARTLTQMLVDCATPRWRCDPANTARDSLRFEPSKKGS